MVQTFNAKVHFFIYAIFTFKVLIRALGCSSWSLYHTRAVRSLEVEKTKSSVTKILQQLTHFGFEFHFELRHSLVYFPGVPPVDEVALAGGDVPLADGGVRRTGVHVDVVQRRARYVLRVAPSSETEVEQTIRWASSARLRESSQIYLSLQPEIG